MSVQYMSFSAHADAKGIMQLIQHCEPRNVLLVHGEASKMEFLKSKIMQEFGIECYMPANGETVCMPARVVIPVDVSLKLLKRELSQSGSDPKKPRILHGALMMFDNTLRLVDPETAMDDVGVKPHDIRFTSTIHLEDPSGEPPTRVADAIYQKMKSKLKDHTIHLMVDSSISVASVLIKVDNSDDDGKNVFVSWGYQDEELGSYLLSLVKEMEECFT